MRISIPFLCCFLCSLPLFAQKKSTPSTWHAVSLDQVHLPSTSERLFEPHDYRAFTLDYEALETALSQAPLEGTAASAQPVVVSLPNAEGDLEDFALVENRVLPDALAAKYASIRTYMGYAVDEPAKKIRLTLSPEWGLKGMIRRADKGIEYVEPIARGQNTYYMAYDRQNFPKEAYSHLPTKVELLAETKPATGLPTVADPKAKARGTEMTPVKLKIFRFACATTGEFSQDHGGTLPAVLATMVDYTNKLNGIYETDLAIRLVLVDNVEKILFLDPATDPYTGETVFDWLNQNPLAMLTNLGNADRYDIGHVFARYKSGAAIGVAGGLACTALKGRGCSAGNLPYGDFFFSVIGQEIGHQWAAGHTWNYCGGPADSPTSACEPGSGSTIMSYNGACGNDNIGGGTQLYYNACSIFQIHNFILNGEGKTCGRTEVLNNNFPIVQLPYQDNFRIPIKTPFELNGSATDPDGDELTYCWEQINIGTPVPLGQAEATSPLFRSFPPTKVTNRVFPRLTDLVANRNNRTELLPAYSRNLSFCLTVRDNRAGGGGVTFDTVTFRSIAEAGPFLVTSPNSADAVWLQGKYETVTWDVANTDKSAVNCQRVNIRLSTDGGFTYPVMLAQGVPNVGRYCLLVPQSLTTTRARLRVEAADNIFFDISNADFTIQAPNEAGFSVCAAQNTTLSCPPAAYRVSISSIGWQNFNGPIALSALNLPVGATATFSKNTLIPGETAELQLAFGPNTPEGNFTIEIQGKSGAQTSSIMMPVTVVQNNLAALALQSPSNGTASINTDQPPVLRWRGVSDADTYEVQVATNPNFNSDVLRATNSNVRVDTFRLPFSLAKGTVYYWRVRGKNACGEGAWVGPFAFSTISEACTTYNATDVPKNIPATVASTVEIKLTVPTGGALSDVNVKRVQGRHDFFRDLEMRLISPKGTEVVLVKDRCPGLGFAFNFGFDDSAPGAFNCSAPNTGTPAKPTEPLNVLQGQTAAGDWILRVRDNTVSSGGRIDNFSLELCATTVTAAPRLLTNKPLNIAANEKATVSNDLLKVQDDNTPAAQLVFTLVSVPQYGRLERSGTILTVGSQFTQADVDAGAVQFVDNGQNRTGTDGFLFALTDGEGGLITDYFVILQAVVSAKDVHEEMAVTLMPNPVADVLTVRFAEGPKTQTRLALYNGQGQCVLQQWLAAGQQTVTLPMGQLPVGQYMLTIGQQASKHTFSRIVAVQR